MRYHQVREYSEREEGQIVAEAEPVAHPLEHDRGDQIPVADVREHHGSIQVRGEDGPVVSEEPLPATDPEDGYEAQRESRVVNNHGAGEAANGRDERHSSKSIFG